MKLTLFTLSLMTGFIIYGQPKSIPQILKSDRTKTSRISVDNTASTTLIPSEFSSDDVTKIALDPDHISIVKIYYIYTAYRKNPRFDQNQLDYDRMQHLKTNFPFLFTDPLIEWEVVEQTGCSDYKNGNSFFHGFVLVHRPNSDTARREEIERLLEVLNNPELDYPEPMLDLIAPQLNLLDTSELIIPENTSTENAIYKKGDYALYQYLQKELYPKGIGEKREDLWVETLVEIDKAGRVGIIQFEGDYPDYITDELSETLRTMEEWNPAKKNGEAISSEVRLSIRVSYSRSVNGMFTREGLKPSFIADTQQNGLISEEEINEREGLAAKSNSVYRGMELLDSTTKLALVMDVTGSMAPNIAAMKRWIEKNHDKVPFTSYSFYNDGDNKPTSQKKKGETGGIYTTLSFEDINETINTAIIAGSGGEISEADIEAILYAIEHDSDCEEILLIGDNYSDIRDISLLKDLNKKVNVLLCSAPKSIRTEYLKLVKETGGFLLLNGVKFSFENIRKGDRITLQSHVYLYNGSEFKLKEVLSNP